MLHCVFGLRTESSAPNQTRQAAEQTWKSAVKFCSSLTNDSRLYCAAEFSHHPVGKQRIHPPRRPSGIFYTANSGIWQTVWLEPVSLPIHSTFSSCPPTPLLDPQLGNFPSSTPPLELVLNFHSAPPPFPTPLPHPAPIYVSVVFPILMSVPRVAADLIFFCLHGLLACRQHFHSAGHML